MTTTGAPSPGDASPNPLGASHVRSPGTAGNSRASLLRPSMGPPRPSSAPHASASSYARPSFLGLGRASVLTDGSNVFAETKLQDAHLEIFETDVVMEGELAKKGEGGLQTWKTRMFVLRGQELSYYTVDSKSTQRYGALKGSMNVCGASVERVDNLSFSLTLSPGANSNGNGSNVTNAATTRVLSAPDVQALFDWMTALAIAAEAQVVAPPSSSSLALVDHSRTTHVLLVRHGHYASAAAPAEDLEGPLTDLGVRQAAATGRYLRAYLEARLVLRRFPRGFPIVHSGVRRAQETARHMAAAFGAPGAVELRENKLFREAWPGNPLPNSNRALLAREKLDGMVADCARLKCVYRTHFRHLVPSDLRAPETPLSEQDVARFMTTIGARGSTAFRPQDRYRVVVCHANIIRWFVCKALGVDPDGSWGRMRHNHAGVTALEIDSVGNVQVTCVNGTGHLADELLSEA